MNKLKEKFMEKYNSYLKWEIKYSELRERLDSQVMYWGGASVIMNRESKKILDSKKK